MSATPTVWVLWREGYPDEAGMEGLYVSAEAALACLRLRYPPPSVVEWIQKGSLGDDQIEVTANFDDVPGYSTKHSTTWSIYWQAVDVLPQLGQEP